jgi:Lhr-like helicase
MDFDDILDISSALRAVRKHSEWLNLKHSTLSQRLRFTSNGYISYLKENKVKISIDGEKDGQIIS